MTMTAEAKAKGDEGEERFNQALYESKPAAEYFEWYRNVRMRLTQSDLDYMGLKMTADQYEARFNTNGDLDFILLGPTGLWLFDVKNWSNSTNEGFYQQSYQGMIWQRDFLRVRLRHFFGATESDVNCGFVMAGAQQDFDGIGEFPIYSMEDAIKTMLRAPIAVDAALFEGLSSYVEDELNRTLE